MICPENINLFIKLSLNHCQDFNIYFLAFYPLIREKSPKSLFGLGLRCLCGRSSQVWGLSDPFTHSQQRVTETLWIYKATLKRELLVQGAATGHTHQLCCILKRCWIMRWRITHVILLATYLSRIVSISYLPFFSTENLLMIEILRAGLCQVGIF